MALARTWEVKSYGRGDTATIAELLADGWEPFAATDGMYHFRRQQGWRRSHDGGWVKT